MGHQRRVAALMERRDALKSLAALAGATGMVVSPVTATDAERVTLVVVRLKRLLSGEEIDALRDDWQRAVEGTGLQGVRAVFMDTSMDVEFVRS